MTQPAKSQEPSMEEILASIRRIIADDDANKPPSKGPDPVKAEARPASPPPPVSSPIPPPAPPRAHAEFEPRPVPPSNPPDSDLGVDQASDILDLTESMAAMPQSSSAAQAESVMPNPHFRTIDGNSDVGFDEDSEAPAPMFPPLGGEPSSLISKSTTAAVDSAFNALAQTVLVQNARTLEDLVREMLRPMLKSWLDDNLPSMVERLVRAEIERVSRGRTG